MTAEGTTPEQALVKLQEDWDVKKDYNAEGPATVTSVKIEGDFLVLPLEVSTYLVALQSLNLKNCKKLESLSEGVPAI